MALQMYFLHNEYSINYSYVFLKLQINFVKVQILGFRSYFNQSGTSLVVQWLRLCPPNTGDVVSTPGQGTTFHKPQLKILHTATKTQRSQTVFFFLINKPELLDLLHSKLKVKHTLSYIKQIANGNSLYDSGNSSLTLCNNPEGWDEEADGREVQEGGDICIPMADSC